MLHTWCALIIVTGLVLAVRRGTQIGTHILISTKVIKSYCFFPSELYSYTEESEFKFNREAFEITAYSQGSNGKIFNNITIITSIVDMSVLAIFNSVT